MTAKSDQDNEQTQIIGRNISALLRDNDMTQVELASRLGLSESAVGKWTSGSSAPRAGTIAKIAEVFGVPISAIVEENAPIKNYEHKFLLDKIAKASVKDLRILSSILDRITEEENKNQ